MKLFGPGAELTELATRIMNEDLAALESELSAGWEVNAAFHVTRHVDVPPLTLALSAHKTKVIHWLLEKMQTFWTHWYGYTVLWRCACC